MTKTYLLLLFLLFEAIPCLAQNNLVGHETWMTNESSILEPVRKTVFEYDESGNKTKVTNSQWDQEEKLFKAINQEMSTYDASDQLIASFYESLREANNFYREEIFVYSGGCLSSSIKKDYGETWIEEDITYYNPLTCRIDSIEKFEDYLGELKQYYVERYFYDGNEELRVLFTGDSLNGFNEELFYKEITRNDMGLITRSYSSFTDIGPELRLYEYDENSHITYQAYYLTDIWGEFELNEEWFYDYTFDEEGKILFREISNIYHDHPLPPYIDTTLTTENYTYFCDGLLDKMTTVDSWGTTIKYFQYQEGHDCGLAAEEGLLSIRPTITDGQIFIESEILQTEGSFISLYDMNGRRLFHLQTNRIYHYFLDLQDLPHGVYVVQVSNGKDYASEQVVKY